MLEAYGSLGVLAGVVQGLYLTTAFVLGGRLALRGARDGQLPALLLGVHLLLAMGTGYLLLSTAFVVANEAPDAFFLAPLVGVGNMATILGLVATLVFNVRVFWPDSRVAKAAAWGIAGLMAGGWLYFGWVQGFPARMEGAGFAVMMGGILLANAWVSFEPLRYYRIMRLRQRLGLAEPLVVDRFLLWGVGSVLRLLVVLIGVVAAPMQQDLAPDAARSLAVWVLVVTSAMGLGTSLSYWLAFRPARWYARWVASRQRV